MWSLELKLIPRFTANHTVSPLYIFLAMAFSHVVSQAKLPLASYKYKKELDRIIEMDRG